MNARDFALVELDRRRLPKWPAKAIARRPADQLAPDDPRDIALAEHLIVGVIKNLLLLQHALIHYSGRRLGQIDPLVAKILAIGLYQLRFMDRIPESAAVDEAVEQSRRCGRARASAFVNAVLRNATRSPELPLPDPISNPRGHGELALSHPPELFDRLLDVAGTPEAALDICRHNNSQPSTLVRLFKGVTIELLQLPAATIIPHERPGICVVEAAKRTTFESWATRGLAQVQDATAAEVVNTMELAPGQRVLDRCAGRGTKTLQIQDELGEGQVVAIDPHPRALALQKLLEGAGSRTSSCIVHRCCASSRRLKTKASTES